MNLPGKRILITGGHGFLGKHLVQRFLKAGMEVLAPSHSECDLTNRDAVESAFAASKPDFVVHAAGLVGGIHFSRLYPAEVFLQNLLIACHVLEMAAKYKVQKLVNIGSACVYSDKLTGPFRESDMLALPMHPSVQYYGFSKQALYFGGCAIKEQFDIHSIHLVPANLYGPGDSFDPELSHVVSSMIPRFYEAAKMGEAEVICWGTGKTVREFLYVEDCAEAVLRATQCYDDVEPLNLGVGNGIAIHDLAGLIKRATGFKGRICWDATKPDGAAYKVLDVSRMRSALAWTPGTSFDEGLKRTVEWFVAHYDAWVENRRSARQGLE